MLSRRIIVVAPDVDKTLQRRLIAAAMAAGGNVQAFIGAEELPLELECDLCLCTLNDMNDMNAYRAVRARLSDGARLCPVLADGNLARAVELLDDERVEAVLSAQLDTGDISATIARLFEGDLFGLQKAMPWGVRVYSSLVGDYHDKAMAIASVSDFAEAMGVRKKYRDHIEQCLDEMLMNALYDAPVDAAGRPLYGETPVKERVALRASQKALLEYACDGRRFALSVRDRYGSLRKSTVLQYLDKCLHARGREQIDDKTSGAGLGLYLIASSATQVAFHVSPGQATEVLCLFELTAVRSQLRALSIHQAVPQRRRAVVKTTRRAVALALTLSLLLLAVAISATVWLHRSTPTAPVAVDGTRPSDLGETP